MNGSLEQTASPLEIVRLAACLLGILSCYVCIGVIHHLSPILKDQDNAPFRRYVMTVTGYFLWFDLIMQIGFLTVVCIILQQRGPDFGNNTATFSGMIYFIIQIMFTTGHCVWTFIVRDMIVHYELEPYGYGSLVRSTSHVGPAQRPETPDQQG